MFLLLILPVIVSGFIVLKYHPYYYYKLHRFDGQLLHITCTALGLCCLIFGFGIVLFCNAKIPPVVFGMNVDIASTMTKHLTLLTAQPELLVIPTEKDPLYLEYFRHRDGVLQMTWIILTGISSILFAFFWSGWAALKWRLKAIDLSYLLASFGLKDKKNRLHKFFRRVKTTWKSDLTDEYKVTLMRGILKDSPLDVILFRSYLEEVYVMVTLSDRKVYVGRVISLGEPNESEGMDQEIVLTPFLSGYRDKDTLTVTFTTKYKDVDDDLSLVIKQDLISSVTEFDPKIYEAFTRAKKDDESRFAKFKKFFN